MSRFLFLTWNGGGNQPPTVAIAQALRKRGHDITFAGYEEQRNYFAQREFPFVLLPRSSAAWRKELPERTLAGKLKTIWLSTDHFIDVPHLIDQEGCDVLVIDCQMFGALAAAEKTDVPTAVFVHTAMGGYADFEPHVLGPINEMRAQMGLRAVSSFVEAWARFPTLSNSIPQLDSLAAQAPESVHYLGPMSEELPPSGWNSPWRKDDPRALVLVSFSTTSTWDQSSRISRRSMAVAAARS